MTRIRTIVVGSIAIPVVFALFGVYGSFLWTLPAVALWCALVNRDAIEGLGLRTTHLVESLVVGAISGVVLGVGCGEVIDALGIGGLTREDVAAVDLPVIGAMTERGLAGMNLAAAADSPFRLALYYLYYIALVGLGEELFWRGLVQFEIRRRTGRHVSIVVAGLAFGSIHAFLLLVVPVWKGLIFLAMISAGGIFWGYLIDRTRNIWGVALSHGITSATIWKFYFFS